MFTSILSDFKPLEHLFLSKQYTLLKPQLYEELQTHPTQYALLYLLSKLFECELNHAKAAETYQRCLACDIPEKYKSFIEHEFYNHPFTILQKWIEQNGGKISGVEVVYYNENYRGMNARYSILKNQNILSIPFECCISRNEQYKTNWGRVLKDNGHSDHDFLALALLDIKYSPIHHQKPILECIPKSFPSVPIFFSEDEKHELIGSYALDLTHDKLCELKATYKVITSVLSIPYTLEDFLWARTAIITRIYGITRNGQRDCVMVPFADMANHKIPPNTTWFFDTNKDSFIVRASTNIDTGETIYETYGKKSNYRYFVNYGFTIPNNPDDKVHIDIEGKSFYVGYTLDDAFKQMYTHTLQICEGRAQDACNYIVEYCETRLSQFPTTIRQDIELLIRSTLPNNIKNCIVMRKGEKRLLRFFSAYFSLLAKNQDLKQVCDKYDTPTYLHFIF